MSTENGTEILPEKFRVAGGKLTATAAKYAGALQNNSLDRMERSMLVGLGIQELRGLMTAEVLSILTAGMNSPMGFLTDKVPGVRDCKEAYPMEVVRECLIAAFLGGLYALNNEFNIIAGRMMPVKNGWRRLVIDTKGVTQAEVIPGMPVAEGGASRVRVTGRCYFYGKLVQLTDHEGKPGRVFAVPVHDRTGVDALIGKAERRAWKSLYELVHGSAPVLGTDEEESGEVIDAPEAKAAVEQAAKPSKSDELAGRLGGGQRGPTSAQAQPDKDPFDPDELLLNDRVVELGRLIDGADSYIELSVVEEQLDNEALTLAMRYPPLKQRAEERRRLIQERKAKDASRPTRTRRSAAEIA